MKHIARAAAVLLLVSAAQPALATGPNGTWTWATVVNQQVRVSTLKLKFDSEGKSLKGYYCGSRNEPMIPVTAVYKGGDISVTVVLESQGEKYLLTFQGSRIGDEIVGKSEIEFEGKTYVVDWSASRCR